MRAHFVFICRPRGISGGPQLESVVDILTASIFVTGGKIFEETLPTGIKQSYVEFYPLKLGALIARC